MKKPEKVEFVNTLSKDMKNATCLCLVDYTGISVKLQQDLKKQLREVGAKMIVVKNSLFKIAGHEANIPEDTLSDTVLAGPTALVITNEDPIAPLQIIGKFAKDNELPQFKVGVVENIFQSTEALVKLSKLPNKDTLVGQVVGAIAAPLYGLVGTLNAPMQKLVYILKTKSEQK